MIIETETYPPNFKKDAENTLELSASDVKKLISSGKLKVIIVGSKDYISNSSLRSLKIEYDKKREQIVQNDVRSAVSEFIEEKILKYAKIIRSKRKAEVEEKKILTLSTLNNVSVDIKERLSEQNFELSHPNRFITFGEMRNIVKKVYQSRR